MNKSELAAVVADKTGLSKTQAAGALDAVISGITDALKAGDKVNIPGFITAEVGQRGERQGRNLRTGEALTIPASKVVKLKAGKTLKDAIAA